MKGHAEVEELSGYLDAELAASERRRVESHLAVCAGCRRRLEAMRRVVGQMGEVGRLSPPVDLRRRLAWRLEREEGRRSWSARLEEASRRLWFPSSIVLTLAVVVALAIILYLFAAAVERAERGGEPLIVVPEAAVPLPAGAEPVSVAGRRFLPAEDGWRQEGAPPRAALRIDPGTPAGRAWLAERPELTELAGLGGPVVLEVDGEWVRIGWR